LFWERSTRCCTACRDLVVPEIARYTEAVQHQHKRRRRITADGAVEYQAGSGFNLTRLDHGRHQDFHRSERGGDEITSRRRGSIRLSLGPLPPRQLSISGSPDEVIADRRLAERNPFRGWSSLSVSESFIRNNCHSTHNCGSERPGVLTSLIRADTRNGGQRSAGASSMRVRNTGSAVASAQPTVSPAWISWVKSSASGAIVIGVFTRLLALSARPEWVEQNQLFGRPEESGISDP